MNKEKKKKTFGNFGNYSQSFYSEKMASVDPLQRARELLSRQGITPKGKSWDSISNEREKKVHSFNSFEVFLFYFYFQTKNILLLFSFIISVTNVHPTEALFAFYFYLIISGFPIFPTCFHLFSLIFTCIHLFSLVFTC